MALSGASRAAYRFQALQDPGEDGIGDPEESRLSLDSYELVEEASLSDTCSWKDSDDDEDVCYHSERKQRKSTTHSMGIISIVSFTEV